MKTVHFICDKTKIVEYTLTPLRHNRKQLQDRGYKVKFFYQINDKSIDCDILVLISKPTLQMSGERQPVISAPSPTLSLLEKARKKAGKVIWFDNSDSTTVTHFELLPFVDLYLKKQLFKDKSLYEKNFVGGRIFTDFYHHHFGIDDNLEFLQFFPPAPDQLHKIQLSWNIGLGNMYDAFTKFNTLKRKFPGILPVHYNNVKFTAPTSENKSIDLFIRTSANLSRKLVAFHRQELIRQLDRIITEKNINGSTKGEWLTTSQFRQSIEQSKILPSPFGWGELGVRDYEAFFSGSVLLKPDMTHMETWPNIFDENKTYIPFDWDFKNLDSKIMALLADDEKRIEIATNGQNAYRESISKNGMTLFCDWFIQQIEL